MKKFLVVLFAVLLVSSVTGSTYALNGIENSSFETGNLAGWTTWTDGIDGSVQVQTSVTAWSGNVYTATSGQYFAELTASSLLYQDLAWSAGDTIQFDWAFLSEEWGTFYNDYALFALIDNQGSLLDYVTLADVASIVGPNNQPGDTGWQTYSYTFGAAGSGIMYFGSINYQDDWVGSKLLVDNVVPEPSTVLLLGVGVLGLVGLGRKKFKK